VNYPNRDEEFKLSQGGYHFIAGIDEVGRGALAGPVVACALILPASIEHSLLLKAKDSKLLSPRKREILCSQARKEATIGIGMIPPHVIDKVGIVDATKKAMCLAVASLPSAPDFLLVDALTLPLPLPQKSIIHGDFLCLSIAVSSICAKVTRDRYMVDLDFLYPQYGFRQNKGYGTPKHIQSISRWGPSPIHRFSFSPLKEQR
jgi:ribonuclease HII